MARATAVGWGMHVFRRPMLPALLAFILGLYVCRVLVPLAPGAVAIAVAGSAVAAWALGRRSGNLTALLLLLSVGTGMARMAPTLMEQKQAEALLDQIDGASPRLITGQVVSAEFDDRLQDLRRLLIGKVEVTSGSERIRLPGQMIVLVQRPNDSDAATPAPRTYTPGTLIRALGVVGPPDGYYNFYGQSRREMLALRRSYAMARVRSTALVEHSGVAADVTPSIRTALLQARKRADSILTNSLPDKASRLYRCMLFSDMNLLDDEDIRIFRDSGTMHLFAVSGMHVAILAFVLNGLFRMLRLGVRASWLAVLAVLLAYVWLLDFIAPALRAYLMVMAYVAGRIVGREVDPLSALLFGAAAILVVEPLALWSIGFQLSALGVASIVVLVPLLRQWIKFGTDGEDRRDWLTIIGNGGADVVNVTLAVTIGLLPLQLYLFQQFNLLAPLANLLEALLAGAVLSAGVAVLALGAIVPEATIYIAPATAGLMKVVYEIARITAEQDWAIVHLRQMPMFLMVLCYALLASGYYMVWTQSPEFSFKSRARLTVHATACLAVLAGYGAWEKTAQPLRIWFLDVGQGDSTLVQLPTGQSLLIDAGHMMPDLGRLVVLPQLRGAGVWPLHGVIATHADADHTGGIPSVLRQHEVRRFYTSDVRPASDEITSSIRGICGLHGIPVAVLRAGEVIEPAPGVKLEVLNPPVESLDEHDNNQSVVLRLTYRDFTALLMADAEAEVENRLVAEGRVGPVTLLKVGHHGSKTSSTWNFVQAVRPQLAVVSCGRNNRFGHPHLNVVQRLQTVGAQVLRTDTSGAVLVESHGSSMRIKTAR